MLHSSASPALISEAVLMPSAFSPLLFLRIACAILSLCAEICYIYKPAVENIIFTVLSSISDEPIDICLEFLLIMF